jgi:hypothetical protein
VPPALGVACTRTSGMAAPDWSVIVPEMDVVCAHSDTVAAKKINAVFKDM